MANAEQKKISPWNSQLDQQIEIINNQATRKFRPEIQGLRALAVLLVAAYHFWFGKVSGGVDVFLLISAFLMAGSFARKIEGNTFKGVRAVWEYWIHVFKRILPLASLTVAGILLGTYLVLPAERWSTLISEAKSVVFYYENWWSINNLVDYYAADTGAASPFRHFWSLSLQGQIYILWPLIFLAVAAVVKYLHFNVRATLVAVFGTVFALSLAYSIYITAASQQTAYYNTFARLWEFALGSLVAIILPWLNIHRYLRAVMGWAGIAMIISCGFIFDVEGVFPGYHALWPTLAASMIIIAGDTQTKFGPEKLLTLPPLLKLGGFSYGLYLVHWPLLVFYLYRNNAEKAGYVSGIGLLAISMVIAYLMTKWVETPLRSWKKLDRSNWGAIAVIAGCIAVAIVPAFGWQGQMAYQASQLEKERSLNNPGAAALAPGFEYQGAPDAAVYPPISQIQEEWADLGESCSSVEIGLVTSASTDEYCTVANMEDQPEKVVVAVGNSHMQVWAPVITRYAQENNWTLYYYVAGGCFYAPGDNHNRPDCDSYTDNAHTFVDDVDPDLVITTGTMGGVDAPDTLTEPMREEMTQLTEHGLEVLSLRDHPRFSQNPLDCATEPDCVLPANQDVENNPLTPLESELDAFGTVNMNDMVCPDGSCPAVIGNVYTYMDDNHLTSSYIETTYDVFKVRADEAMARING